TREGSVKGKLGYLAPEQLRGTPIDRRVDIFAAGVVLWEALTGSRAFRGTTDADTVAMVLTAPILPPSTLRPEIPATLDEVVLRALARDRDKRFATADELAVALERAVAPATQAAVGEWVRATAGDEIAARRDPHESEDTAVSRFDEISRIEPIDPTLTSAPPVPEPSTTPDVAVVATREPARPRGPRRALLAGVIGSAVLLGAVATYLASGAAAPSDETAIHEPPPPSAAHEPASSPPDDVTHEEVPALAQAQLQAEAQTSASVEAQPGARAPTEEARLEHDANAEAPEPPRGSEEPPRARRRARAATPQRQHRSRTAPRPAPRRALEPERETPPLHPEETRAGSTRFEPLAP